MLSDVAKWKLEYWLWAASYDVITVTPEHLTIALADCGIAARPEDIFDWQAEVSRKVEFEQWVEYALDTALELVGPVFLKNDPMVVAMDLLREGRRGQALGLNTASYARTMSATADWMRKQHALRRVLYGE